jgi:hypothetical protein
MRLETIKWISKCTDIEATEDEWIAMLIKCAPALLYDARARAIEHYDTKTVTQAQIRKYILHEYQFDAIEISKIVAAMKKGIHTNAV